MHTLSSSSSSAAATAAAYHCLFQKRGTMDGIAESRETYNVRRWMSKEISNIEELRLTICTK